MDAIAPSPNVEPDHLHTEAPIQSLDTQFCRKPLCLEFIFIELTVKKCRVAIMEYKDALHRFANTSGFLLYEFHD